MVYQGSKSRIAKYIVPILQGCIDKNNVTTYIEPFVGGANIIDKIKCKTRIGYDINWDLICLLNYAKENNSIPIAPEACSFEEYKNVREKRGTDYYSDEYTALIGFCASYGGRYFDGGYGRANTPKRNIYKEKLANLRKQAPFLKDIQFYCMSYTNIDCHKYKNCVFYLDPPYRNTKKYIEQNINYEEFYNFVRKLSKENFVFISEYWMPDDFVCIWEKEIKINTKSDRQKAQTATEKLFVLKEQKRVDTIFDFIF